MFVCALAREARAGGGGRRREGSEPCDLDLIRAILRVIFCLLLLWEAPSTLVPGSGLGLVRGKVLHGGTRRSEKHSRRTAQRGPGRRTVGLELDSCRQNSRAEGRVLGGSEVGGCLGTPTDASKRGIVASTGCFQGSRKRPEDLGLVLR